MTFLLAAISLGLFALPLLKSGAQTPQGRIVATGFDGVGVLVGFVITVAVAALTSPIFGLAFVAAVLLHECASALACRHVGHDIARVRLVPLPRLAPPRVDRRFSAALEESFVALYAPALSIVPMVMAFALFHLLAAPLPSVAAGMRALAIMLGAFNFVMLLPFLPFAGGRVIRAVSDAFWPQMGVTVTVFMTAAFASAALRDHSIAMGVLAAAGLQSLIHKRAPHAQRLTPNEALLVMAGYAFTLAVHFMGGYWLIKGLI